jgi:aminopeptidase-like protein
MTERISESSEWTKRASGALSDVLHEFDAQEQGQESYRVVRELYPICRSITGDGVRQSLRLLQGTVPLELHAVSTGTQVQ